MLILRRDHWGLSSRLLLILSHRFRVCSTIKKLFLTKYAMVFLTSRKKFFACKGFWDTALAAWTSKANKLTQERKNPVSVVNPELGPDLKSFPITRFRPRMGRGGFLSFKYHENFIDT
jgi:hypothetical protein